MSKPKSIFGQNRTLKEIKKIKKEQLSIDLNEIIHQADILAANFFREPEESIVDLLRNVLLYLKEKENL